MSVHLDLAALDPAAKPSPDAAATRKNLAALSLAVAKCRRMIVVTGAGISCSSGIPDFRSSDGLYNLVKSRHPNVVLKGKDLFSASLFREPESTRLFYSFIAELKSSIDAAHPSPTHHFLKTLDARGKLLRSYTQNIDGIEEIVGIAGAPIVNGKARMSAKDVKNVQLHGDIHRVRCVICNAEFPCEPAYLATFLQGNPPDCPECLERCNARVRRNARPLAIGTLRPNIVLYEEAHPLGEEIGAITTRDMARKPDMLVIMGTSLKVHGIKKLVKNFASAVHQSTAPAPTKSSSQTTLPSPSPSPVKKSSLKNGSSSNPLLGKNPKLVVFVNRTPPPADLAGIIDCWVEGDTDSWVAKCEADWRRARPQDWEVQATLFDSLKDPALAEENINWQVVKETVSATKPRVPNKGVLSPRAENLLPPISSPKSSADHPIPTLPPVKRPILKIKLKSRTSASFPTVASLLSPKKRPPTLVDEEWEDLPDGSLQSPKKRRVLKRAVPTLADDEVEVARGLLFGSRKKNAEDMSLDDITPPPEDPVPKRPSRPVRATTLKAKGGIVKASVAKRKPTVKPRVGTKSNPITVE